MAKGNRHFVWDLIEGNVPPPPTAILLGWTPISLEPGDARIRFTATEQFLNLGGTVQGGILGAMLDDTMGPAAGSVLEPGYFITTLEMKLTFLRPARPGLIIGHARVIHHTRSLMFLEGSLETENGEQIATVSSTARIVQLEPQPQAR